MTQPNQASISAFQNLLRVLALVAIAICGTTAVAQNPAGWVLVDDMWLPQDVVSGDATYSATPWTGGIVPYSFNANVNAANQQIAIDAMAEWSAAANVSFVPRTSQTNYIVFTDSSGNNSYVGMIGGAQTINIFNWNYRFIVCHEIMHALGFFHEQQRPDRNTYVTIQTANITAGYEGNFTILPGAATLGTTYDFDSVMHYGPTAFSNNGQPTIVANAGYTQFQSTMGQRQHLSLGDCQGCSTQYGAAPAPTVTALSPNQVAQGSGTFTLTVTGTRFNKGRNDTSTNAALGSRIKWNGTALTTTYVNPTTLTASVSSSLLTTSSNVNVTVENPTPGGGTSNALTFQIGVTPPVLTSISPVTKPVGAATFNTTLAGSNFQAGAVVRWNGATNGINVTSQTATQLVASVPAALLASATTAAITVANVNLGVSGSLNFTVTNPVPTLTSVAPAALYAGAPLNLTLTGTGYNSQSSVLWNGSTANVTVNSFTPTSISATIAVAAVSNAGAATIAVTNPAPGGGTTANINKTVQHPVPTLTSVSPLSFVIGSPTTNITLTGTGFDAASVARWGATALTTTWNNNTSLSAAVPASLLTAPGTFAITVVNPAPVGGTSAGINASVTAPPPVLSAISPVNALAGAGSLAMTCTGSNFSATSVVRFDGLALPTTYNSPTSLLASLTNAQLQVSGAHTITVSTPAPGGGASGSQSFTVIGPSILSMAPSAVPVSATPVNLSFFCFNVGPQSVVYANGVALPTTLNSASSLSAVIPGSFGALAREGGIAINVANTPFATTRSFILKVGTGGNGGIVTHYPLAEPVPPGTTFSVVIEGGTPGAPFSLFYDFTNPAPVTNFPTAAANQVLALTPAGLGVIVDGIGIVGPPIGTTLAPVPPLFPPNPLAPPGGSFTLPGVVSSAVPLGVTITIQAVYLDPAVPGGIKLTWARHPIGL